MLKVYHKKVKYVHADKSLYFPRISTCKFNPRGTQSKHE